MAYPEQLEKGPKYKCRKWRLRANLGINPRTGKYVKRSKVFYGKYRDATKAAEEFEKNLRESLMVTNNDSKPISFDLLCSEWIDYRRGLKLAASSTIDKNYYQLQCLKHHLAKIRSDKLNVSVLQKAISALLNGDSPSGRKLSTTYINGVICTGDNLYKYAIKHGLAYNNPFAEIERPKDDTKEREDMGIGRTDHLKEMCTPTDEHNVMIMLAMMQGFRRQDCVFALVKDVDFKNGNILARGTKTDGSYTVLPLNPYLKKYLMRWISFQAKRMRKHGLKITGDTPLVANEYGMGFKDAHSITQWWERNRHKYDCEGFTFHDIRHAYSTKLARNRVSPAAIQKLMRHRDPRTAQRIYTHINKEDCRDELKRIEW